ncbi:ribosome releasing factor [Crocosphaera watsonii WH 8501]|uniref:Ribosome releasing factor n=6 Tax=Crocosphaera TaxID=263510 RepID=Q4BV12_CROWT|nr:ribosome releasing factor [Crocosphaera watsonii WH 8501]
MLDDLKDNMQKSVEATQRSFNTIRTGRANPAILDRVTVDYYGTETPLNQLANISTP